VFYGDFKGRQKIAEMIDDWFHRTARDFRWEMFRPVSDGTMLYAYYTFSYVSTLPEARASASASTACRSCGSGRQDRRVPRGRQRRRSACSTSASRPSASQDPQQGSAHIKARGRRYLGAPPAQAERGAAPEV
jgi:hypothetical protein